MPNDVKPPWKFRSHLLELPSFCKEMKSGIRETIINKLLETDQIPLTKKDFRFIKTEMLQCTLIKASSRMQSERKIDPLDTIYECFIPLRLRNSLRKVKTGIVKTKSDYNSQRNWTNSTKLSNPIELPKGNY